jgi:hypothetical protein
VLIPANVQDLKQSIRALLEQYKLDPQDSMRGQPDRAVHRDRAKGVVYAALQQIADFYNPGNRLEQHLKKLEKEMVDLAADYLSEGVDVGTVLKKFLLHGRNLWSMRARYQFLCELQRTYSVSAAARKAGVSRATVHKWRQDPAFDEAYTEALEEAIDRLEYTVYQRALDGDTQAAIAILRAARPEKYRPEAIQQVNQTLRIEQLIYEARQVKAPEAEAARAKGVEEKTQVQMELVEQTEPLSVADVTQEPPEEEQLMGLAQHAKLVEEPKTEH